MTLLTEKTCIPCQGGVPPLTEAELEPLMDQLGGHWIIVDDHHLEKEFAFDDFKTALAFVNQVGQLAEVECHHPDIFLSWGLVGIQIYTHKINGLQEADFILAAKIDQL